MSITDSSWSDLKKVCVCCGKSIPRMRQCLEEKFATFQVTEWHSKSAVFLSAHLPPENSFLTALIKLWLQLTNTVPRDGANAVMISISSAVCKYMLQQVRALSIGETEDQNSGVNSEGVQGRIWGGGGGGILQQRWPLWWLFYEKAA